MKIGVVGGIVGTAITSAQLPIRRGVRAADNAAVAVRTMANTAVTGAIYDIDGGQHFVAA
jgi:hypothetical protein